MFAVSEMAQRGQHLFLVIEEVERMIANPRRLMRSASM